MGKNGFKSCVANSSHSFWSIFNVVQMFVWRRLWARQIFRQKQKVRCHGNGMLCTKHRTKCFMAKLLHQCMANFHGILIECWDVGQHDTFLDSDKRCVAMVTAHVLWAKMMENIVLQTTSSVFARFPWNLAQMCALSCRCARHIFE